MNHIYRVIWNHARRAFMVVAENVGNAGRAPSSSSAGSVGSCAVFVLSSLSAALFLNNAQAADGTKAANGNTSVYTALNGVQVVDIATANAGGLSHNRYLQYNVDTRGQILNNHSSKTSPNALQSQLGGQIMPNMNLGKEAKVILNEVVAANRSALKGYTEVVGGRADVVVANPYGITCSGCGFINTDRATLTTGTPVIGSTGQLERFQVTQGEIAIEGKGLDGQNQKMLDLVARQVKIDGQINAQDLQVATGSNEYNYQKRSATAISNSADTPLYAIDSTALGGMYANRIQLLATENGVGVRMRGEAAASADDFTLSANGKIEINNSLSADQALAISTTGSGISVSGADAKISAKHNIDLSAQHGEINLNGASLSSDRNLTITATTLTDSGDDAKRYAKGNTTLSIKASSDINGATWGAGAALNVSSGSLLAKGGAEFYSGGEASSANKNMSLTTTTGALDLSSAKVQSPGDLQINSAAELSTGKTTTLNTSGTYQVSAAGDLSHEGALQGAKSGSVSAEGDLLNSQLIQAEGSLAVSSKGNLSSETLKSGGQLTLSADGDMTNSGLIYSKTGIDISKATHLTNKTIQSDGKIGIKAVSMENLAVIEGNSLELNIAGALDNAGRIQAEQHAKISAGGDFTNAQLIAGTTLDISAASLNNSKLIEAGSGRLNVTESAGIPDISLIIKTTGTLSNSGVISAADSMKLSVDDQLSNGAISLDSGTSQIIAGKHLDVSASSLSNHDTMSANKSITLDIEGDLDNRNSITAVGAITVNATGDVTSKTLQAGSSLSINGASLTNSGSLQAVDTLSVNTTNATSGHKGTLDNQGEIKANKAITLTSGLLKNTNEITGGANVTLTATRLDNSTNASIGAVGALLGNFSSHVSNSGSLSANETLTLNALGYKITSNALQAMKDLTINAGALTSSTINSGADVKITLSDGANIDGSVTRTLENLDSISATGALTIQAAGYDITSKTLSAGQSLSITATNLTNRSLMEASEWLKATLSNALINQSLDGTGALLKTATIKAKGDLTVNADGRISSDILESGANLLLTSSSLANHGKVQAVGTMIVDSTGVVDNLGTLSANKNISLTGTTLTNNGDVRGHADITLSTSTLNNNNDLLASGKITGSTGDLTNNGVLRATQAIDLTGGAIINTKDASLESASSLSLTATSLSNEGTIKANGAINLMASTLTNYATLLGASDVTITAGTLTNSSTLRAFNNLKATLSGALSNSGSLIAGIPGSTVPAGSDEENADSQKSINITATSLTNSHHILAERDLELTITGALANTGTLQSGSDMTLGAGELSNSKTINAGADLNITAAGLSNDASVLPGENNQALINAKGNLTATTTVGALKNTDRIQATGDISLSSASTLDNQLLRSNGSITLNALSGQISNHTLYAVNDVTVNAKALRNSLLIHAGQLMNLSITGLLLNQVLDNTPPVDDEGNAIVPTLYSGAVEARDVTADEHGATLKLTAGQINNAGTITTKGVGKLTTTGAIGSIDSQRIESGGNLIINASSAVTNHDTIFAGNDLYLDAQSLLNNALIQANRNADVNTSGLLTNTQQIQALGNLSVSAGTDLDNQAQLKAGGTATLTASAGQIINHTSEAVGDLTLSAQRVTNSSSLISGNALSITTTTGELINSAHIEAKNKLSTTVKTNLTNNGTLKSGGDVAAIVTGSLLNTEQILAGGNITATISGNFDNEKTVKAVEDITATVGGDLSNGKTETTNLDSDNLIQAGGNLNATVNGNLTNRYLMQAVDGDLTLNVGDTEKGLSANLDNHASILAGGTLNANVSQHLHNHKTLLAAGLLKLDVGKDMLNKNTVQASGLIDATIGGNLTNGLTTAQRAEAGLEGTVVGKMIGGQGFTAKVAGALINHEVLHGNDAVGLKAASITNHGGISSIATLNLTSTAGDITNKEAATLYSGGAMTLVASKTLRNASTGNVNSNDNVTSDSTDFINNGAFTVNKNLTITTTNSFVNETLLNGKKLEKVAVNQTITDGTRTRIAEEGGAYTGQNAWRRDDFFSYEEALAGDMSMDALRALDKAQLLAIGSDSILTINYGKSGENIVGVISADHVTIKGDGKFTNEEFALHKVVNSILWVEYEDKCAWPCDNYLGAWARVNPQNASWAMSPQGKTYDTWNPGAGWQHLGYSRTDGDLPNSIKVKAQNAAVAGGLLHEKSEVIDRSGAGIFANNLTMITGELNNVGSPWASDKDKAAQSPKDRDLLERKAEETLQGAPTSRPDISNSSSVTGPSAGGISGASRDPGTQGTDTNNGNTGDTGVSVDPTTGEPVQGPAVSGPTGPEAGTMAPSINAPNPVTPYENKPGEFSYSFDSPPISLPTNPYGYFVISPNISAGYLVESNPLYAVGSNFVGSNYIAERYGFSPDTMQTRLGDANYEGYLIRQQLLQLTGNNVIAGYNNEADQMMRLMDQAYNQGQKLGLVFGKTPTAEQLAQLTEDIVWMEEVVVNGVKVLAPKVYLSASTSSEIISGAVISGTNSTIKADSLNNTGGSIAGSGSLDIETRGDITNTSGDIKGGNVSVKSTEGSITNQTHVISNGDDAFRSTAIGKTAGISSTGTLSLDANQDIKVIGADVSSGGDASLVAGGEIVIDTIVDHSTTTTSSSSKGFLSSSSTTTTTDQKTHIGSQLNIGGNLSTNSGGNTVIAGSDVNVAGDLDSVAGGNFSVIARQDTLTVNTESSESGFGVAGGAYGSQSTKVNDFTGTNSGATLNVGGNASIDAEKQVVVQGSDVTIDGNASIDGKKGIAILDGHDQRRTTTVVETTTFLSMDSGGESDSNANAKSAANGDRAKASASAGAEASAKGEVELNLLKTSRTVTNSGSSTSVGSSLNVGGDLDLKSESGVNLRGSEVNSDGNVSVQASSLDVRSGVSTEWSDSKTTSTSLGLFIEGEAKAEANAQAKASGQGAVGASAKAGAEASAEATATLGLRTKDSSESSSSLTNSTASLSSGGNMTLNITNTATFQGAEVSSGADMAIDAGNIRNLAVQDVSRESSMSTTNTLGLYAGAEAEVSVSADAKLAAAGTQLPGAQANAKASASVEGSVGLRQASEIESSSSTEITQVTNTFSSGGNFSRTAKDTIVDQGTQVDAGGDITQSARVIRDEAVADSSTSSEAAYSHDLRIGAYAGAGVEASAQVDPSKKEMASADTDTDAGYGFKASAEMEVSGSSESSSTAVTSRFKAGGNISSSSTEKTTLVGAQMEAGKDINLQAGSLDVQAARNTYSESSMSTELAGEVKISKTGGSVEASASFENSDESSNTAQAASFKSGGNLNVTTSGNARFEGAELSSTGDTQIQAGGNVDFAAARSTSSSSSVNVDMEAGASVDKKDSSANASFGVGATADSADKAEVGSIKTGGNLVIRSGGSTTLEGTQAEVDGSATLQAKGGVQLKNASSKESSTAVEVGAGFENETKDGKTGDDVDKTLSVDVYNGTKNQAATINAKGGTNTSR